MSDILFERNGAVLIVSLNRPMSNNSITAEVFKGLLEAFQEAERDDAIRVVVTRANGRSWCVGADAGDLSVFPDLGLSETFENMFAKKIGIHNGASGAMDELGIGRWVLAIAAIQKPLIASIGGATAGGGLALALLHHFRIASTGAKFTTAFGKLGLGSEMGLSATLPSLVGRQAALEMLLTSRLVDAQEAFRIGLVSRLTAPDQLDQETLKFAHELAEQAPLSVRAGIRSLTRPWLTSIRDQLECEWRDQKVLFESQDFKEGLAAFQERRNPKFVGR